MIRQPPVIDISEASARHVHQAIDAACRDWGVFQVVGHGIDLRLMAALRRQMRGLFGAPLEDKRAIARTAGNPWGFYDRELTRHARDWKQVYDYGPPDGGDIVPQWPSKHAGVQAHRARVLRGLRRRVAAAVARDVAQSRHAGRGAGRALSPGAHQLPAAELLPEVPDRPHAVSSA